VSHAVQLEVFILLWCAALPGGFLHFKTRYPSHIDPWSWGCPRT